MSLWGRHCWSLESQALRDWSWELSRSHRSSLRCPRSLTAEEWRRMGNPSGTNCWNFECNLEEKRKSEISHELWNINKQTKCSSLFTSYLSVYLCCLLSVHLGCSVQALQCWHLVEKDRSPGPWHCHGQVNWAAPAADCEDGGRCRVPRRCLPPVSGAYPIGDMMRFTEVRSSSYCSGTETSWYHDH